MKNPLLLLADATARWSTFIWACVVVIFFVTFRAPITTFFERLSRLKFKADKDGVEVAFDTNKVQEELTRAVESKSEFITTRQPINKHELAQTIERAAPRKQAALFSRAEVLWVDDRPNNNIHERKRLRLSAYILL